MVGASLVIVESKSDVVDGAAAVRARITSTAAPRSTSSTSIPAADRRVKRRNGTAAPYAASAVAFAWNRRAVPAAGTVRVMDLGLTLGYWGRSMPQDMVTLAVEAEKAGFDAVWTAESWGSGRSRRSC